MSRENVGLTVGAGRRNDDFKLYHECNLSRNDSTTKPPATTASHDRRRRVTIRNARAIAHVTMAPSGGDERQHDCCLVIGIEVGGPGLARWSGARLFEDQRAASNLVLLLYIDFIIRDRNFVC